VGRHRRAQALGYGYKARHPEGTRRADSGHAGGLRTPSLPVHGPGRCSNRV